MPNEGAFEKDLGIVEDASLSSPPSDEWIPLIEASKLLGLKSIRQVYRRIIKHNIQHRRIDTGSRVRSLVRREDVLKSRMLSLKEMNISDVSEETTDVTSERRLGKVGHDVMSDIMPQIAEFIEDTGSKLAKLEDVRSIGSELLVLLREIREEGKKREKDERLKARVVIISYIVTTIMVTGIFGYLFWLLRSGRLFGW